jgi:hypothetical protein
VKWSMWPPTCSGDRGPGGVDQSPMLIVSRTRVISAVPASVNRT